MAWQAHWEWWHQQPEILAADQHREEQQRQQAWRIRKLENRIDRHAERLQRAGFSQRQISVLKRMAGVTPQELDAELSRT